jgi:hypothetical protein
MHAAALRLKSLQDLQPQGMRVSPTSQSFRVFVKAIVAGLDNWRKPIPKPTNCSTHKHAEVMAGIQTGTDSHCETVRTGQLCRRGVLQQLQVMLHMPHVHDAILAQLLPDRHNHQLGLAAELAYTASQMSRLNQRINQD